MALAGPSLPAYVRTPRTGSSVREGVAAASRAIIVLAGFLLAAPCSGCGGGREAAGSRPMEVAPTTTVGEAGVSVELPHDWHAGTAADGNVVDPLTRVVASSAPVRLRDVPCQIARYGPPRTEVTLVVVEWEASGGAHFGARPERVTPESLELHPPPAIECFDGSGGSIQFSERGRFFGAYLFAGERAPQRLIARAFDVLNTLRVAAAEAARRLTRSGISIDVPAGWDGRILFRDAAGSSGVIFQVANFELPPNSGFEPPQELEPGQEDPIKAMDTNDVLITIMSDWANGEPMPEPLALDQLRFLPDAAPRVPVGHTLAEGSFCYGARCVRIEVDFGGRRQPDLESAVNGVLASLDAEPRP